MAPAPWSPLPDVEAAAPLGFPVFEGDDDELVQKVDDFPWVDLKRASGSYAAEAAPSDWKALASSCKDGVAMSMYSRRVEERPELSEFLIRGCLPILRDAYFVLNADVEYRPEWDDTTTGITELSSSGPDRSAGPLVRRERVLHWRVKYPWPLGKRDYVLEQGVHTFQEEGGDTVRCIQGRTLPADKSQALRPLDTGVTRVEDHRANMAIWNGPAGSGANFALLYFEDFKVSLPAWLVSKVAASTIPAQLAGGVKVGNAYPAERTNETLSRFGILLPAVGSSFHRKSPGRPAAAPTQEAELEEPDEEDFFSASDEECQTPASARAPTPRRQEGASTPAPSVPTPPAQHLDVPPPPPPAKALAAGGASAAEGAARAPTTAGPERRLKSTKVAESSPSDIALVRPKAGAEGWDLEEGLGLKVKDGPALSNEERELLLELLQETRDRKQTPALWWCPCRRRLCGRSSRYKV